MGAGHTCCVNLPHSQGEAGVDSLRSHTTTSHDPAALGEDGMGVVWVPRGPCWPGFLPRVLAPLQGRQRCIPCPVGVPGLRVAPCAPLDPTQSPFPAGLLSPGWLALRWALTAVCLLVLGDHPTLSILLGVQVSMPSPIPPGVQGWGTELPSLAPHPQG